MKRKHISWKTKCAALAVQHFRIPYTHAKQMTETQLLSLLNWDHGIFHETQHPERDKFWNIEAKLIREHREKTKRDQGIIAKSRRNRKKQAEHEDYLLTKVGQALSSGFEEGMKTAFERIVREEKKRKIPSRVNPWPPKGSRRLQSKRLGK